MTFSLRANVIAVAVSWVAGVIVLSPYFVLLVRAWGKVRGSSFEAEWWGAAAPEIVQFVWPWWGVFYSTLPIAVIIMTAIYVPLVKAIQRDWSFRSGVLPGVIIACLDGIGFAIHESWFAGAPVVAVLSFLFHGVLINWLTALAARSRLTSASS